MEIGIVGLANVGKSTLFNALLKKQASFAEATEGQAGLAKTANYPFTTIEPNVGIVPVPDERLEILAPVVHTEKIVPATVKFIDIAGLIKGASTGEGLGNKFLANIREVDAIAHVVRAFEDPNIIREGSTDPKSDYEIVRMELELADLQTKEKREEKKKNDLPAGRQVDEPLQLLTEKPEIIVYNVSEEFLSTPHQLPPSLGGSAEGGRNPDSVIICAKMEAELASLGESDAEAYLKELGITETGLDKLIKKAFEILGLSTFLTAGEKEVRAWVIHKGTKAPQAAGVIHTDFEKHFIKADVVNYRDFVNLGGWTKCREAGKVRMEGREYVMQEDDLVEFKVGV